jgi:hypothetical protein
LWWRLEFVTAPTKEKPRAAAFCPTTNADLVAARVRKFCLCCIGLPLEFIDKATQIAYTCSVEFFETAAFVRIVNDYLNDEELRLLQSYLLDNPDAGKVIKQGKESRKLRWATSTTGKSGGLRIIYFHRAVQNRIYLLLVYSKREKSDLTPTEIQLLAKFIEQLP